MADYEYRRLGAEFRVNTTTSGAQTDASVTSLADGGFILSWTDASLLGGDASGTGIKAQRYDADGNAVGGEFLVNSTTAGSQYHSEITGLAAGGFVVSWTDASGQGGDASGTAIKAQVYSAAGTKVGSEFLVNTATANNQADSSITALSNGGFVISWGDSSLTNPDRSGSAIRGQIYDATGTKVGGELLLNTITNGAQITPTVSATAGGGFVVSWADSSRIGLDTNGYGIKVQRYDAVGAKLGPELLVNTTTFNNQLDPTITTLASGKFVVAWTDSSFSPDDPDSTTIRAQVFNADGTRLGTEVLVNTSTKNSQQEPVVTALATGGFAISWADNSGVVRDTSGYGIRTQFFDDNGNKAGTEFLVNTTTLGSQNAPTITALASGGLVIAWTDYSLQGGDASSASIKAQIIAPTSGVITDLGLTSTSFSEASAQNTVVAALFANGAINAAYQYELVSDSTGGAFRIEGNRLIVQDSLKLDFESSPSPDITVRVTDQVGNTYLETVQLSITDSPRESRYSANPELLANTQTVGGQVTSTVTQLQSGGFVVTWADGSAVGGDTSSYGIKAQVFNADGTKVGAETLVNTVTAGTQSQPTSGALADGGFVVAWTDASPRGGPAGASAIIGQRYDAQGQKVGGEIVVGPAAAQAQTDASVTGLETGGFVVTWTDSSGQYGDASGRAVLARVFDAAGNPTGATQLVNVVTSSDQQESAVAALDNGGFVVTWRDASLTGGDNSSTGIKARIYDANGSATGTEFLVNTVTKSAQLQPAITNLLGGGFAIAWTDNSGLADPDYYGVKVQIFSSTGAKIGSELLVNTSTLGAQQNPVLAPLASGGFVVSWYDFSGAGGEDGTPGIRSQSFSATGARLGSEVSVNAETIGTQGDPSVAGLASGAFVVAYTDNSTNGGDLFDTGIKVRIFEPIIDPNAAPALRAIDDNRTGIEEQSSTFTVADLLANDVNGNGGILTLASITAVVGGTVTLNADDTITFTPNANFDGRAAFDYVVEDGTGVSDTGRVFVQVAGVNDAPTAFNDAVNVAEDGITTLAGTSLTGNDTDPDTGDVLRVVAIPAMSAAGTPLALTAAGAVTFDAGTRYQSLNAGEAVVDSFSYTVSDSGGLTSTATATVTIVGANDAPANLALSGSQVDENAANGTVVGTVSATDVDSGDVLTYSLTNNAGGRFAIDAATGVLTIANGSLLDYETAASHTIQYRATDTSGAFVTLSAIILLNDLPEARLYNGDNGANIFTAPTNDYWTIYGNGGNDTLTGNASADTIYGGSGNDLLDGRGGNDTLLGGVGADIYYVDSSGDIVVENFGEGIDIVYATASFVLSENIENITLNGVGDINAVGNSFNNTITGNSGNNVLDGGDGRDLLTGNGGDDRLVGNAGGDWLMGGAGNDILVGGAGSDELTGGAGLDQYVFDSLAPGDIDIFKDFTHGDDKIVFSQSVFAGFSGSPLGALSPDALAIGAQATTADHHVIYNPSTGGLFYDADGVGGVAAIQIGSMAKALVIDSNDILLIA